MSTIPGRDVDVTYGDCTMQLYLDMGVGIGGDKWPAAENFCALITSQEYLEFFKRRFAGRRVIELGSGNGLVGILIDKLFQPKEVCITDHPSHMKHIERNVLQNKCNAGTLPVAYDWTGAVSDLAEPLQKPFDVILALECVYREDLYLPLIRAIKQQSHKKTLCFLGSTRQFTKPLFFHMLELNGLGYKKLPSGLLDSNVLDESIDFKIPVRNPLFVPTLESSNRQQSAEIYSFVNQQHPATQTSMFTEKLYSIEDSGTKGMVAVATRDILPGELVVEEKEPLLYFSQSDRERYKSDDSNVEFALAGYNAFMRTLTSEQRQKFVTLYGPTSGVVADNLRMFLKENAQVRYGTEGQFKTLTPLEIEVMVKVLQVIRLNMFGKENEHYSVYSEITRWSHSCASNCDYSFRGQSILCYARCFIKAGEELTISYNTLRDMDPTHERRHKYLEMKEFTCHCPRCDAAGDDTRQFDCFDSDCKGVMMVCQPINKKEVRVTHLPYTGVEYVEPHLLPCTKCHRAAPADYQTAMLALETTLLELGPRTVQRLSDLMNGRMRKEMEPLYKELLRFKLPTRHGASLPLLKVKWRVLHCLYLDSGPRYASALQDAVTEYLDALENICTYPGHNLSEELALVVEHCSRICFKPVFPPLQEKALCLKALRLHLLLNGRETRYTVLDGITVKCHERLPSTGFAEVCAFCEESPQRAALTLSRCGQCRLTVYCSVGCQKAHWKLHKKTCKLVVGWK